MGNRPTKTITTTWDNTNRNNMEDNRKDTIQGLDELAAKGNNLQSQLDNLVVGAGTSPVEVQQARVDKNGTSYTTLDARLEAWEAINENSQKKTKYKFDVTSYGAKGDWNGTTGTSDAINNPAFLQAIEEANGNEIYIPEGKYLVSFEITDQHVNLVGPGTLIHQKGKHVIKVKRTLGNPLTISSISTVQIGPSIPAVGVPTETNTRINMNDSLNGIVQGDLFHIISQDTYPFCVQMTANKGYNIQVWKAGFVPIHGLGLDVSGIANGGISENDIVTGSISGATALVLSCNNSVVVFGKINGTFASGENLLVNGTIRGTANGKPYIIMAGKLIDSYSTNPVIRKVSTDKKFSLNGLSVEASGDIDSIVGSANRMPAFKLSGVTNPTVKNFTVNSAWTRCFQLNSCWQGDVDIYIKKLPDNANESESAYGYGVELAGATEGCKVEVNGGNCRHGFTTNVFWGGFQYMEPLECGTVKYNDVWGSMKECLSASFDTHEGAYFTTFHNCRSINSRSGLRNVTASAGFQNRGFGTVYKNCIDNGSVIGFIEAGLQYDAGFPHTVKYFSCDSDNYQQYGFYMAAASFSDNGKLYTDVFKTSGDGSTANAPYYQAGFYLRPTLATLKNCESTKFNGTPFQFVGTGGRFNIINFFSDYYEAGSVATGFRFDGAPSEFNFMGKKFRVNTSLNVPAGLLRVASGSVFVNTDGINCVNTSSPPPISQITGGTLTITQRAATSSVRPTATNGDVSITITPRKSMPIQIFNAPLTADRTVTLDSATGVCINGDTFRIVRQSAATGSFNLTVGAGNKILSPGQWCEVTWNGGGWTLTAFGTL